MPSWMFLFFYAVAAWGATTEERADQLLEEAVRSTEEARYEDAIRRYKETLILNKNALPARFGMVHAYLTTNRPHRAIRHLRRIRKRHGTSAEYFRLLGLSWETLRRRNRAIGAYESGLETHPNAGVLYHRLGETYLKDSQGTLALELWQKGIEADPEYAHNYRAAAEILNQQSKWFWSWIYLETFRNLMAEAALPSVGQDIARLERHIFQLQEDPLGGLQPVVCLQKDMMGSALSETFEGADTELGAQLAVVLEVAATLHFDEHPEWAVEGFSQRDSEALRALIGRLWTRSPQHRNVDSALFSWWAKLARNELLPVYVEWLKHGNINTYNSSVKPEEWMQLKQVMQSNPFRVGRPLMPHESLGE